MIFDHPDESIGALEAATGDRRIREGYEEIVKEKGECRDMCEWIDHYIEKGVKQGELIGIQKGLEQMEEHIKNSVIRLFQKGMDLEFIAEVEEISLDRVKDILKDFKS